MDHSKAFESVDSTDNSSTNAVDQETSSGRRRSGRIHKAPDYFANAFNETTGDGSTSSRKVSQKKRKSTDSSATESAKEDKRIRVSDVSRSSIDSPLSSPSTSPGMSTFELLQKAQLDATSEEWSSQRASADIIGQDGSFVATDSTDGGETSALLPNSATGSADKPKKRVRSTAPKRKAAPKKRSSGVSTTTTTSPTMENQEIQRPKPHGIAPVHAEVLTLP